MTEHSDIPLCSRAPNPDRDSVPIRLDLPPNFAAALDGLAHIDGCTRKALCEAAISEYINRRLTDMTVVLRMAGRNAVVSDSEG
jgi:hypothetical protein